MLRLLLITFLFQFSFLLNGQELIWADYIRGSIHNQLISRDFKIDKNNNIYVYGITKDSLGLNLNNHQEYHLIPNHQLYYYFIVKYDKNKNYQWHKIITIPLFEPDGFMFSCSNIDIDDNANVYIMGSYPSKVWIHNSMDTLKVKENFSDFYLILNSKGDKVLFDTKKLNYYSVNYANLVVLDTNSFIVNYYYDSAVIKNYANVKDAPDSTIQVQLISNSNHTNILFDTRDKKGVTLWHKTIHSKYNLFAMAKTIDLEDNLYISGVYDDELYLDTFLLSSKKGTHQFFIKLTKQGHVLFFKDYPINSNINSDNIDKPIETDSSNNFYTNFYYSTFLNCDPKQDTANHLDISNNKKMSLVLNKYSKNGDLIWSFETIKNKPKFGFNTDLKVFKDKLYLTGSFYDSVEFLSKGKSQKLYTNITPIKNNHLTEFLAIYNLDGHLLSAIKLREILNSKAKITKVDVDYENNIVLLGDLYDSVDFDPSHQNYFIGERYVKNIFLAKYKNTILSSSEIDTADLYNYEIISNSINSMSSTLVKLFPNPVIDFLQINFNKTNKKTTISVYDISGRLISSKIEKNVNQTLLDLNNTETGIYFIHLTLDNEIFNFKVFKK